MDHVYLKIIIIKDGFGFNFHGLYLLKRIIIQIKLIKKVKFLFKQN